MAQRALERVGYTVVTAADGLEALEVFHGHASEIDLIITDVVMPRLGGVALHRTLREEGHTVRFLFTSGYAPDEMPKVGLEGEPELLQKPWALTDLTNRVRQVLDSGRKD